MLSTTEKSELKPAAAYISGLPKVIREWAKIREELEPDIMISIENFWPLLGISLDAFFSDAPNPLFSLQLDEDVERLIQKHTSKYLSLSILLFQAESFLREEAHAQGIPLNNLKRSDFLKIWAIEECLGETLLYLQNHWEGYSRNQWKERRRESQRYAEGEISESRWEILNARWAKEDSKLALGEPPPESQMPFTKFCLDVFKKYRQRLPEFARFTELLLDEDFSLKVFIVNGKHYESPRRKGKKQKE